MWLLLTNHIWGAHENWMHLWRLHSNLMKQAFTDLLSAAVCAALSDLCWRPVKVMSADLLLCACPPTDLPLCGLLPSDLCLGPKCACCWSVREDVWLSRWPCRQGAISDHHTHCSPISCYFRHTLTQHNSTSPSCLMCWSTLELGSKFDFLVSFNAIVKFSAVISTDALYDWMTLNFVHIHVLVIVFFWNVRIPLCLV